MNKEIYSQRNKREKKIIFLFTSQKIKRGEPAWRHTATKVKLPSEGKKKRNLIVFSPPRSLGSRRQNVDGVLI